MFFQNEYWCEYLLYLCNSCRVCSSSLLTFSSSSVLLCKKEFISANISALALTYSKTKHHHQVKTLQLFCFSTCDVQKCPGQWLCWYVRWQENCKKSFGLIWNGNSESYEDVFLDSSRSLYFQRRSKECGVISLPGKWVHEKFEMYRSFAKNCYVGHSPAFNNHTLVDTGIGQKNVLNYCSSPHSIPQDCWVNKH